MTAGVLTRGRRRRRLISLTPLIDVVFILFVFFLLASSFSRWRAVEVAAPVTVGAGQAEAPAILIDVKPAGIKVDNREIEAAMLADFVVSLREADPARDVVLRAGAGVTTEELVGLLDRLTAVGLTGIRLVAPAP